MKQTLLFISMLFLFTLPQSSYGYIDLGSGSYFIQIFIAMAIAALYSIRSQFHRLLQFLYKKFQKKNGSK